MRHRRIAAMTATSLLALAGPLAAQEVGSCGAQSRLDIVSASDDGSNDGHTPDLAIDGDFAPDSRWSSEMDGKELLLDMGAEQTLEAVGLAFYKGDERTSGVAIDTSVDGTDFTPLAERTDSTGTSLAIERFEGSPRAARNVRVTGFGNAESAWNSVVEVQAFGCGPGEIAEGSDGSDIGMAARLSALGLDTTVPPSGNFDLSRWKITLPVDRDGDGRADEIGETEMAGGWSDPEMFYTDPVTGGMVFRVVGGDASTPNSSYSRVELREMIRAGDTDIPTRNLENGLAGGNNWVFSAAPQAAQDAAGGVDGTMTARLAVNQVSRQGDASKAGRVMVGQIHARDDEPIRLYYRKLPTNKFGSVYYIQEREGGDIYVPLIGDRGDRIDNPEDGIALDETFGYAISVTGEEIDGVVHPVLNVSITRDDRTVVEAPPLDMIDTTYAEETEWMFFKAGAYSGNNTSPDPERDYDQVTFFELDVTHP